MGKAVAGKTVAFIGRRSREVAQQIDTDRRRQARFGPVTMDLRDQLVEGLTLPSADLMKCLPHRRLKSDAGPVAADRDVAIDEGRDRFDCAARARGQRQI